MMGYVNQNSICSVNNLFNITLYNVKTCDNVLKVYRIFFLIWGGDLYQ